jgi:hypothetical protein
MPRGAGPFDRAALAVRVLDPLLGEDGGGAVPFGVKL